MLLDMELREEQDCEVLICMMTEEVTEELTVVIAEKHILLPKSKEVPVVDSAREKKLAASKQNFIVGSKDILHIQRT